MRKLAFAPRGHSQSRQPRPELLEARLLLASGAALTTPLPATSAVISAAYGQLPMSFEANQGQTDSQVSVLTRGAGYASFLTPNSAVLSLQTPAASDLATTPAATTQAATAVTSTTATLNGSVDANNSSTDTLFQYSTDPTVAPHVVTTFAGTAGQAGSADGTGAAAGFNEPDYMAVDRAGNVYVADTRNATIRKITPSGVVTTLAGTAGQGGSADGTGATARFNKPNGLAVDSAGNIYVADTENDTIRKITPSGVVTTLAGSAGQVGSTDGTGAAARFDQPYGVGLDAAGNVYVTDASTTIRKITPSGVVTTLAGSAGQVGSTDGTGAAARFNNALSLAVDGAGNVYVADTFNYTIRKITPSGVVTTLAGTAGQPGSTDGTGATARFNNPSGVALDAAGNVYATDAVSTLRRITPDGVVTTVAGSAGGYGSVDGSGTAAKFEGLFGAAVDGAGNVYVADTLNDTIRKVSNPTVLAQGGLTGASPVSINAPLTDLQAGTTYYYRAVATNPAGSAVGMILSFTTPTATIVPTATVLSSSLSFLTIGQPVTFTANVTVPQGSGAATGTVTFMDGTLALGTGTLDGAGLATYSTSSLAMGNHTITAAYDGNDSFAASSSSPVDVTVHTVALSPTVTTLTPSPTIADLGRLVTFTASVSEEDSSAGPSTLDNDSVIFTIDGTSTSVRLQRIDGQDLAVLSTATLTPGVHSVTAAFAGDSTFAASNSPLALVTINAAPTATTLSAPQITAMVGQPVSFTVIVGQPNPDPELSGDLITGLVTFSIDGQAGSPVSLQDVNDQKIATLTTSSLAAGTHILTASFGGNDTFASSVSNTLMIIINSPTPTPTPTPTPPSIVASDGPLVMNLRRFGFHAQPTVLVLTFSKDLNVTTANNTANYKIVPIGPHGKFGAAIAISRIAYDPAGQTVTLHPSHRLNVHKRFELIVDGTSKHAVTDLALDSLDGGHTGKSGSDYIGKINWSTLDGPSLRGKKFVTFWLNQQHRHGFGS
jgi:sugar lactone lactonase YvrE